MFSNEKHFRIHRPLCVLLLVYVREFMHACLCLCVCCAHRGCQSSQNLLPETLSMPSASGLVSTAAALRLPEAMANDRWLSSSEECQTCGRILNQSYRPFPLEPRPKGWVGCHSSDRRFGRPRVRLGQVFTAMSQVIMLTTKTCETKDTFKHMQDCHWILAAFIWGQGKHNSAFLWIGLNRKRCKRAKQENTALPIRHTKNNFQAESCTQIII